MGKGKVKAGKRKPHKPAVFELWCFRNEGRRRYSDRMYDYDTYGAARLSGELFCGMSQFGWSMARIYKRVDRKVIAEWVYSKRTKLWRKVRP